MSNVDFVTLFLEHTKAYESPTSFWRWAAYSTIGSTLRNNVLFKYKDMEFFPNTYTVLLADSAAHRKGAPLKLAGKLLETLRHTKVLRGSTSKEAMLEYLSSDIPIKKTGITIRGGQALLLAEELASFFIEDPKLIQMMTDLYDSRENYERRLRSGTFNISNLCLSMLAGSNQEFLRDVYDKKAVYGGLLRRTFMVKPDETRKPNSLMWGDELDIDLEILLAPLREIQKLKGKVIITEGAKKCYDAWYEDLYNSYGKFGDRSGVLQGMHANVIKLAIILAANEYTIEINEHIFGEAIIQVNSLRSNYEVYAMGSGSSDQAKIGAMILESLWEAEGKSLTRQEILIKHWNDISTIELDEMVERLKGAGMLIEELSINGINQRSWKMTDKCIDIFEKGRKS